MKHQFLSILLLLSIPVFAQTKPDPIEEIREQIKKISDKIDESSVNSKIIEKYKKDSVNLANNLSKKDIEIEKHEKNEAKLNHIIDSLKDKIENFNNSAKSTLELEIKAMKDQQGKYNVDILKSMLNRASSLKVSSSEINELIQIYTVLNHANEALENPYNKDTVKDRITELSQLESKTKKYPGMEKYRKQVNLLLNNYCSLSAQIIKKIQGVRVLDEQSKIELLKESIRIATSYPYLVQIIEKSISDSSFPLPANTECNK